ncbi:MAG: hypothetical protein J6R22_05320 [Alphaproteobacteria bacterium]|nr:hypothetical protein [Alphaproteobacteria bacterium]
MATELYGVNAHVSETLVQTPVTVETNIVFYGTSPSGTVGTPILITSWADAVEKLGVSVDDGYTLTDACLAAFQACNISHIYCIPVANTAEAQASDYTSALLNISDLWMQYGVIANILVAPRCQDSEVIAALVTAAKKQNGQWDGIVIYDGIQDADQLDANGRPVLSELTSVKVKTSTDDITVCHWGYAKLLSGAVISGAAFRACRWAIQDMQNNGREPSRCSGNLSADIQCGCIISADEPTKARGQFPELSVEAASVGVDGNALKVTLKQEEDGDAVRLVVYNGSEIVASDRTNVNDPIITYSQLNAISVASRYVVFSGYIPLPDIPEESASESLEIQLSGGSASTKATGKFSEPTTLTLEASNSGVAGNNLRLEIYQSSDGVVVDIYDSGSDDPATPVFTSYNGIISSESGIYIDASTFNEFVDNNDSSVVITQYVVATGEITVPSYNDAGNPIIIQLSGGSNGESGVVNINAKKSDLDQLSADGIDSFLNIGGGKYVTWGDHTAAFNNAEIQDERGRFDNYPRMRMRITNRFEQKWRPSIDAGMDAELRRYILNEEQDFLYHLVSVQALVGSPRCEFRPQDNTKDSIAKGHFYFKDFVTYTPPAKYIDLGVSFTDEGYTVYLED